MECLYVKQASSTSGQHWSVCELTLPMGTQQDISYSNLLIWIGLKLRYHSQSPFIFRTYQPLSSVLTALNSPYSHLPAVSHFDMCILIKILNTGYELGELKAFSFPIYCNIFVLIVSYPQ